MPNTIPNPPRRTPRDAARPDAPTARPAPPPQAAAQAQLWQTHRLRWCISLVAGAPVPVPVPARTPRR